ncbi:MAG: major capsid protein [Paludibacteraceae bacterium]
MDALKSKGQMLDQINLEQIPRSGFDLSYNNKGTGKIGRIIPIRCMETLPGDSIKGSSQIAMQFEPLAVPILANMRLKSETWYCPNHILWDGWDNFITKGQDLSDTSKVPSISLLQCIGRACYRVFGNNPLVFLTGVNLMYHSNTIDIDSTPTPMHNTVISIDHLIKFVESIKSSLQSPSVDELDDLFDYSINVIDDYLTYLNDYKTQGFYIDKDRISDSNKVLLDSLINGYYVDHYAYLFRYSTDAFNYTPQVPSLDGYLEGPLMYNDTNKPLFNDFDSKIYPSIKDNSYYIPSEFAVRLYQFLYDMISPLCGLGSNLDYLSYRCLSPVDCYYNFVRYLNYKCHPVIEYLDEDQTQVSSNSISVPVQITPIQIVTSQGFEFNSAPMSVLPLRALYAIWWNNYRDQLLETASPEPCTLSTISDDELLHLLVPRLRCWSKDTFTTALANTGTGNMVVPISNSLSGYRTSYVFPNDSKEDILDLDKTSFKLSDGTQIDLPTRFIDAMHSTKSGGTYLKYGFSLDTLRRAGRTEKWIQKALIYGNRIQDALFTHWGVKIKNERIQLPEFVTSSVQLVKIDTILNNTTTSESIAGDKAGFASAYDQGNGFDFYSPENGILLSLMSVLPEQSYSGGVPRFISKLSIFDFAFPEFAQIGMDAVYLNEIATLDTKTNIDAQVFGYQGRYYDYKCKQDEEHGELKSSQDMYTFSRTYNMYDENSRPKLNYRFVHCHPALDMFVVDDPSQDQFRYDIHHSVACSRALPVCGMSV